MTQKGQSPCAIQDGTGGLSLLGHLVHPKSNNLPNLPKGF